jgi:formate hydrogenlyase subunit 6/NADH:ubiquinone oxidoreductase subunit I
MRLGKTVKKKTPDQQVILERRMIGLVQMLALDQNKCTGCRDCQMICPSEAISSSEPIVEKGSLKKPIRMDIDPNLCHFCGQCVIICPTKAFLWRENQQEIPSLISNGIFPVFKEEINIQTEKCQADCRLVCETSCPVDAIKVKTHQDPDTQEEKITAVEVDKIKCFYCHKCELACPYHAIKVDCARDGIVIFSPVNCPQGCYACSEICPSGALHLENERVKLDESACIYCRSCQNVCPVDSALEIKREKIRHYLVRSQLWVEIQGKLVSKSAKGRLMEEIASNKRSRAFRTRID